LVQTQDPRTWDPPQSEDCPGRWRAPSVPWNLRHLFRSLASARASRSAGIGCIRLSDGMHSAATQRKFQALLQTIPIAASFAFLGQSGAATAIRSGRCLLPERPHSILRDRCPPLWGGYRVSVAFCDFGLAWIPHAATISRNCL